MSLVSTKNEPPVLYVDTIRDYPHHVEILLKDWYDILQFAEGCLKVKVDVQHCKFLGHIGVTFLGGIVRLFESRGGHVTFDWNTLVDEKIRMNLAQNRFLYEFGYDRKPWDGNSVPYRRDLQHDPIAIADYLVDKWLGKGWVNISPGLQNTITGKVVETYFNAFEHSHSPIWVISCGQRYPESGTLQLTVVDFGIGIPNIVRTLPKNVGMTASKALKLAFESVNSTKQQDVRQGEGLHILQEFVKKIMET
ncbi:hypothetical protein [Trichormus azollae]|uniref:hypothetical protein n=1 Tax=Trichormus azollae TaxID=1164 RepID=UPI00325E8242